MVQDSLSNMPSLTESNKKVLEYIEKTLNDVIRQIGVQPYGHPQIRLNRITSLTSRDDVDGISWDIGSREIVYTLPGKNEDEAWRFGMFVMITGLL